MNPGFLIILELRSIMIIGRLIILGEGMIILGISIEGEEMTVNMITRITKG